MRRIRDAVVRFAAAGEKSLEVMSIRTRLVIAPNASLSSRQAWAFIGLLGAVSLSIGGFFAVQGFWPILPFAGLELIAVAAALVYSLRRNAYREVLSFDEQTVEITTGEVGRGIGMKVRLPRSRTRVLVEPGVHRNHPSRLLLCCGAQTMELGRCLTDEERDGIAQRMRELIHPGWRAAPQTPARAAAEWLQK